jgi:hypothetical protein
MFYIRAPKGTKIRLSPSDLDPEYRKRRAHQGRIVQSANPQLVQMLQSGQMNPLIEEFLRVYLSLAHLTATQRRPGTSDTTTRPSALESLRR